MALVDELKRSSTSAVMAMTFTVVDPVDGTLEMWLGGSGFTFPSGKVVYPAVVAWGALREMMPVEGKSRDSELTVTLDPKSFVVSTTNVRTTVANLLRYKPLHDVAVTVYQWNKGLSSPAAMWSGYYLGIAEESVRGNKQTVSIRLGAREVAKSLVYVSDVITKSAFASVPEESLGKMVPRVYGSLQTSIVAGEAAPPSNAVWGGFGTRGVIGVAVDEQQSDLNTKVRFAKNDGAQAAHTIVGNRHFLINMPEANTIAFLNAGHITTLTNDTAEVAILVASSPLTFVANRLGKKGTKMKAAFDANSWKVFDGDPTNYLETTSTDFEISFEIPSISVSGMIVSRAQVWAYLSCPVVGANARVAECGIWDPFNTGAAGWLGNAGKRTTGINLSSTQTIFGLLATEYIASDFKTHVGADTFAEFAQGQFIGRDTNDAATPLEVYLNVTSASKDQVRCHGLALLIWGTIGMDKITRLSRGKKRVRTYDPQGRFKGWAEVDETVATQESSGEQRHLSYFCAGVFQKDSGTTYQGGGAGDVIRKGAGIAHHMLDKIGGMAVNTVASTLGNFTDAKVEDVAGEKNIDPIFGPDDKVTMEEALNDLMRNHSVRVWREEQTWRCAYHDMNPHESRYYRSSSDIVRISGKNHVIPETFQCTRLPYDRIRNRVTVNCGHAIGTDRPLATFRYDNPLSQDLFGVRTEFVSEEPWITVDTLGVVPEAAKFRARYLGRVQGRPIETIVVGLPLAFHDLQRGHVIEFDSDMEDVGIESMSYRCGRFNYAFFRIDLLPANQADDATPTFLPAGSTTSTTVWSASQQVDRIQLNGLPGTGSYTEVNNGWKYYNGSTWTSFSNVVASDGGDPDGVFKRAGNVTISWDYPSPWLWKKAELSIGGTLKGPDYWFGLEYASTLVTQTGNGLTTYPAKWRGRLFEVIEVSPKPGGAGRMPYIEAVLQEVM